MENEATCKGFRFPAETISHAVWLYHRFPLSYHEVEKLLLVRGILVSDETIRAWCDRFGPQDAAGLRRRRPQAGDKRHWTRPSSRSTACATTCGGPSTRTATSLDILVQSRRDAKAAKRLWPS